MNYGRWIFLGAFLTFASAWLGLVLAPNLQLRNLQGVPVAGSASTNPPAYNPQQAAGRQVYVAEGCMYCHSQQVRGGQYNADLKRGWGKRRSVPIDYINDVPQLLGTMRTGPDLVNVAGRRTDAAWHLRHLYNPQKESPGSIMAPFPYLFERRPIAGSPSADALVLPDSWTASDGLPADGYEIVPTERGRALAAYLLCLSRDYPLESGPGGKP